MEGLGATIFPCAPGSMKKAGLLWEEIVQVLRGSGQRPAGEGRENAAWFLHSLGPAAHISFRIWESPCILRISFLLMWLGMDFWIFATRKDGFHDACGKYVGLGE